MYKKKKKKKRDEFKTENKKLMKQYYWLNILERGGRGVRRCEEKTSVMLLFSYVSGVQSLEHDVRVNRKCTKYNNRNII